MMMNEAVQYLADTLADHLGTGKRVLWLVSGGSVIQVAAAVARKLKDQNPKGQSLEGLAITLTDERFGPAGHPDSNWKQLAEAGFVLAGSTMLPVLIDAPGTTPADPTTTANPTSLAATTARFGRTLQARLAAADYSLGLFGIGPDGHTAGIMPHSPAVSATGYAFGYDARELPPPTPGDATYERITMTVPAIAGLDEAVVYAVGKAKWPVLAGLRVPQSLSDQPAQALKSVHKLTIFSDYTGEQT